MEIILEMDITLEDIYKYGTKEEVKFLMEALDVQFYNKFLNAYRKFKDKAAVMKDLQTTYAPELEIVNNAINEGTGDKVGNLRNWILGQQTRPQAEEILKKFEGALNIYKGAFGTAETPIKSKF